MINMATLTGYSKLFSGSTAVIDDQAMHLLGTRSFDKDGNEYIYLKGVASTAAGDWVSFDEAHATIRAIADAVGRIAIAMAAIVANKYGWYLIYGTHPTAAVKTAFADNGICYLTSTAGSVDDTDAAGDLVLGAIGRSAGNQGTPATASAAIVEISYPHVNDTADD